MAVLVTGGAGYIGTHTCVELLNSGYDIVVVDNFDNSKPESLRRVREITGKDFKQIQADLLDRDRLEAVFRENQIEAVIHFAGLKAVGESVRLPLKVAVCYANPAKARERLGWAAERDLAQMCEDAWRWQQQNPNGYGE